MRFWEIGLPKSWLRVRDTDLAHYRRLHTTCTRTRSMYTYTCGTEASRTRNTRRRNARGTPATRTVALYGRVVGHTFAPCVEVRPHPTTGALQAQRGRVWRHRGRSTCNPARGTPWLPIMIVSLGPIRLKQRDKWRVVMDLRDLGGVARPRVAGVRIEFESQIFK
jgi:hypothetical protein